MEVVKAGILDTFQDRGRYGYAHFGVGAGGCMDRLAGQLANMLMGNEKGEAVLEMHFPAPMLHFVKGATIALTGGNFSAIANGVALPLNRRIDIPPGAKLQFTQKQTGQRCYLGVAGGWQLEKVLGSYSNHLKAGFGGWQGRALRKGDYIPLRKPPLLISTEIVISKWFIYTDLFYAKGPIRVVPGPEWDWLSYAAKKILLNDGFTITRRSDRMGYHLKGPVIQSEKKEELLSSGVLPGTVQLLPNGNPLLLMADCQTTGGYPRILQVAMVDMPRLAQMGAGESLHFEIIDVNMAADLLQVQLKSMQSLPNALALL
jgi:antagonist of KipI